LLVCLFGSLLLAGCGGPAPEKLVKVKGTVTLDQKPLSEGEIMFNVPGKAPNLIPVKNGAFEGQSQTGKINVQIRAYKPAPPIPPMPGLENNDPGQVNYLPARYNDASTLEAEVPPGGKDDFKFELKSGG
jgi:hypothetical protein